MLGYIVRRLLLMVPTLLGVSVILFALIHLAPGGPEGLLIGDQYNEELAAQVRHNLKLDRPVVEQYLAWLGSMLRGNFGRSFFDGVPVTTMIGDRVWAVERGVKIAMGSDAGTEFNDHGTNPGELGYMTRYSAMSPMDAIVSSTRSAADLLDIGEWVGTIAPGRKADLIAVRRDPTEDATAVEDIAWVMKGGKIVHSAA